MDMLTRLDDHAYEFCKLDTVVPVSVILQFVFAGLLQKNLLENRVLAWDHLEHSKLTAGIQGRHDPLQGRHFSSGTGLYRQGL